MMVEINELHVTNTPIADDTDGGFLCGVYCSMAGYLCGGTCYDGSFGSLCGWGCK